MKTHDIIIPHFSFPIANRLAVSCLASVRQYSLDYRVIWIQNGGLVPPEVQRELERCEKREIVCNSDNLGFVKAVNQGLEISEAPFIVILNNDTRVVPSWFQKLRKPLALHEVGLSGPLSTARGSWQGQMRPCANPWIVPDRLNLAFFCVMIRRDCFEKVGLLDTGFGLGLGDDDDYCARARKAGYKLALAGDLRITHRHRTTFNHLFTPVEIRNIQLAAVSRLNSKANA